MARQKNLYSYSKKRRRKRYRLRPVPILILVLLIAVVTVTVAVVLPNITAPAESTEGSVLTPSTIMQDWSEKQAQISQSQSQAVSGTPDSSIPITPATHDAPVPLAPAVDMSYFDDALFIGDSRTEGFMMYSGVDNATYYAYKGLSVRTAFTKNVIRAKDGSMTTVENALKQQSFGKVYIMLGINELGWPNTDVFIEEYSKLIDTVKATSPNAIIYIQLIMPVSEKKAGDAVYNNDNINRFNTLIKSMVKSKEVYYVDPGEAVSADGWLVSEATTDGIHLNKDYCIKWRDYLMSHTVQK